MQSKQQITKVPSFIELTFVYHSTNSVSNTHYVICILFIVQHYCSVPQMVLPAMKTHPRQLGVQMAATACLYNLSKAELGQKIHPQCLKQIIELTLKAMENFPNHQQVIQHSVSTKS